MTKQRKPLTPQKQLANVYDSLAADVMAGYIDTDEETNQRASRIAHTAIEKALTSHKTSGSFPERDSQREWTKRTDKDKPASKRR